ncbi:hypothetical protein M9H77_30386 [Catharanthus roseus]|uniref:Uncharacterized protein n=1 Tax=Catharanthus roseus TaxID=4058 RepID=A0ACB9ZXF1_CATRO|nr:hypothetical protein M9H77_30386 [Catharanthus roseus]
MKENENILKRSKNDENRAYDINGESLSPELVPDIKKKICRQNLTADGRAQPTVGGRGYSAIKAGIFCNLIIGDQELEIQVQEINFNLGNWKDNSVWDNDHGFNSTPKEKRHFPLRVSEEGDYVVLIRAPKEKKGELVPFDPEPERMLRGDCRALQFETAGTSAIVPVDKTEDEPPVLPINNPLFLPLSPAQIMEPIAERTMLIDALLEGLQTTRPLNGHMICRVNCHELLYFGREKIESEDG